MRIASIAVLFLALTLHSAHAKECWALSQWRGQSANSVDNYVFGPDKFLNPMVLCFNDGGTGTVSGDDTKFVQFGTSTLVGLVQNRGLELVETYQIDRVNERALFTKSRIGTATLMPSGPDIAAAFVGKATKLSE
jgi:hypothetical protein